MKGGKFVRCLNSMGYKGWKFRACKFKFATYVTPEMISLPGSHLAVGHCDISFLKGDHDSFHLDLLRPDLTRCGHVPINHFLKNQIPPSIAVDMRKSHGKSSKRPQLWRGTAIKAFRLDLQEFLVRGFKGTQLGL